jgi:hypothetical protein
VSVLFLFPQSPFLECWIIEKIMESSFPISFPIFALIKQR